MTMVLLSQRGELLPMCDINSDFFDRELLRMQLLYQMQQQLPSSILSNPSHALAFVDHVISTSTAPKVLSQVSESSLRFVKSEEEDEADSQTGDILRTAVDFLLSSLEGEVIPPNACWLLIANSQS
jgi:hypothetical protein